LVLKSSFLTSPPTKQSLSWLIFCPVFVSLTLLAGNKVFFKILGGKFKRILIPNLSLSVEADLSSKFSLSNLTVFGLKFNLFSKGKEKKKERKKRK
jgi:hypothetical protein